MAKRFYEEMEMIDEWDDLAEVDQMRFTETAIHILIESPERKMLQQIKDYVNNPEMVDQFSMFGRGGAPMLASVIRKSFEGEDNA